MEAAIGRRFTAVQSAGNTLRYTACVAALLTAPCWADDAAIASFDLADSASEQLQELGFPPSTTPQPRLSLTLGTPMVLPGMGAGPQALDLGVQWRQPVIQDRHVDITAWRRITPQPDALTLIRQREPVYGARVEFNLKAKKRGLVADRRFIGLQLDSGARITIRRKNGNPVLYYRAQF